MLLISKESEKIVLTSKKEMSACKIQYPESKNANVDIRFFPFRIVNLRIRC